MPPDRPGQDRLFQILSLSNQVLQIIPVGDPGDVLLDDRPLIELLRHVMGGGPDHLHPAREGLLVGLSPDEGRQEAVMDIDDRAGIGSKKSAREDLHISGQHDEIHPVPKQREDPILLRALRLGGDRHRVIFDSESLDGFLQIRMVTDHQRDLDRQLAGLPPPEQIHQAMALTRHHDGHPLRVLGVFDPPIHSELACEALERLFQFRPIERPIRQVELDPQEKGPTARIGRVLVGLQDVPAARKDKVGHPCHDSLAVRAGDQENDLSAFLPRHHPPCP